MRDSFEKGMLSFLLLILMVIIIWVASLDHDGWSTPPASIEHGVDYQPSPTYTPRPTPPSRDLRPRGSMRLVPVDGHSAPLRICHPTGTGLWRCVLERQFSSR